MRNKIIIRARQSEWIICSPHSVNNAALSILTSSERHELAESRGKSCSLTLTLAQNNTIVLAELEPLRGHKTSLKNKIQ